MIQIYTIAFNKPEFIKYQYESLFYLMENTFEYIVINNANNSSMINQINSICLQLNIKCITATNATNFMELSGYSHINGLKFAYSEILKSNTRYFMIIDHDIFLYKTFNINNSIDGYELAGVPQNRNNELNYLWPGFLIGDLEKMPNKESFDLNGITGVTDVGGELHYYLKNNNIIPNYISEYRGAIKDIEITIVNHAFIHFINGSNWANVNIQSLEEKHRILLEEIKSNYLDNKSRLYWEDRYENNLSHHSTQNNQISTDFIKNLLNQKDIFDIFNNIESVLEIGCGSGELCSFLPPLFTNLKKVKGFDISAHSVKWANEHYSNNIVSFEMKNILIDTISEKYDLVLTSNTLEHFRDPFIMIDSMLNISNYVCLLVPYNQPCTDGYDSEGGAGHVYQFVLESFDEYNVITHFTFKTDGWQHSSCGEDPLQLVVLLKRKE